MRDDLKRAVKLVREGYSYTDAARKVGGITRNAVAGACDRAGVRQGRTTSRDGGWTNRPHPRSALAAALYAEGLTYKEIRERLNVSSTACIGEYLKVAGVKPNRRIARE